MLNRGLLLTPKKGREQTKGGLSRIKPQFYQFYRSLIKGWWARYFQFLFFTYQFPHAPGHPIGHIEFLGNFADIFVYDEQKVSNIVYPRIFVKNFFNGPNEMLSAWPGGNWFIKKTKVENLVSDFLYVGQGGGVGGLWTYNHCVSVISEHTTYS